MMPEKEQDKRQWSRQDIAEKMAEYDRDYPHTPSQRQLAEQLDIPRSTLQHWLARKKDIAADPELVAFFESPAGVVFLHRLVLAAHFVITLVGPGGIRLVCLFLELTGLDHFVAASYGPQWQVSVEMEQAVGEFAKAEKVRLSQSMPLKQIAVCEDETFHPETCLVAIEPVSNFIVLEQYAEDRKADTWTQTLTEATTGLSVQVIQSISDEGRGLLHHVKEDLGLHHSPDLFHVQHELVKGLSGPLSGQVRQATRAEAKVSTPATRQALENVTRRQQSAQQSIRDIGAAYHPYDLQTGAVRSAETVSQSLARHFATLETVAQEAGLSEKCFDRIEKAKRVVVGMVATLTFYFLMLKTKVEALSLAPAIEQAVYNYLIPAIYLQLVSGKTPDAGQRRQLQTKSADLLAPLLSPTGPFGSLEPEEKEVIEKVARECAELFQRSSSCVEGRNGQLALRHHSLHRLSDRKLAALTAVHNYFITRPDGTTAAERFFGSKPKDLFEWLLNRVDCPGRPAQKRSLPKPKNFLVPAAS
jgi:hypothetical protein